MLNLVELEEKADLFMFNLYFSQLNEFIFLCLNASLPKENLELRNRIRGITRATTLPNSASTWLPANGAQFLLLFLL